MLNFQVGNSVSIGRQSKMTSFYNLIERALDECKSEWILKHWTSRLDRRPFKSHKFARDCGRWKDIRAYLSGLFMQAVIHLGFSCHWQILIAVEPFASETCLNTRPFFNSCAIANRLGFGICSGVHLHIISSRWRYLLSSFWHSRAKYNWIILTGSFFLA